MLLLGILALGAGGAVGAELEKDTAHAAGPAENQFQSTPVEWGDSVFDWSGERSVVVDGDGHDRGIPLIATNTGFTGERTVECNPGFPGFVDVSITGTNAPIEEGSTLDVTADLTNSGGQGVSSSVTMDAGSLGSDQKSVFVGSCETETKTFTVGTGSGDADSYTVTVDVESNGGDDQTTVSVTEPPKPYFSVSIIGTNSPKEGNALDVTAEITNTGDAYDTQTVQMDAESLGSDSTDVSLSAGQSATETFTVGTGTGDAGYYTVTVSSNDDSITEIVQVVPPEPNFAVSITDTNGPVAIDELIEVTAEVTNIGDGGGSQSIALELDDDGAGAPRQVDSADISLSSGESTTLTLSGSPVVQTTPQSVTAIVSSEDDTDAAGVDVVEGEIFSVSITGTTGPVTEGEVLTVTSEITNTGGDEGTQTIDLDIPGLGSDSTTVSLLAGNSKTVSLEVSTNVGDVGSYTATVSSADDSEATDIQVEPLTPNFAVSITGTNGPVPLDEPLEVTADITNTGGASGSQSIALELDDDGAGAPRQVDSADISLSSGESTTLTLSGNPVVQTTPQSVTAIVSSEDDTDAVGVDVVEGETFSVSITGTTGPVTEGGVVTVTSEITNTGGDEGTQTIDLDIPGLGSDSAAVSLQAGNSKTVSLEVSTNVGDVGSYTATVSSADDSEATGIQVEPLAPNFVVNITGTNGPVPLDEPLEVTADITNTGGASGSQSIVLELDDDGAGAPRQVDSADISLSSGESTTLTLSGSPVVQTTPQSVTAIVSSENDTDAAVVDVVEGETFSVSITGTTGPVAEGEVVTVTSEITNTGGDEGTQTINLDIPGLGSDSTTVSLLAGSSTTVSLGVNTNTGDVGSYTATVSSADDSEATGIQVEPLTPNFAVSITGTNGPVPLDEPLEVAAEVTNTGNASGSQSIVLELDDDGAGAPRQVDSADISLSPGESTALMLSGSPVVKITPRSVTAIVSSENDTDAAVAAVIEGETFSVSITGTTGPVTEGEVLTVTSEITNIGGDEGTQTINLDIPGLGSDSTTVSLQAGSSTTVSLEVNTNTGDVGSYTATVSSADDSEATDTQVEPLAPNFVVNITGTNEPVSVDEPLEVTADVTNTGDASGSQSIVLELDDDGSTIPRQVDSANISLSPGESTTLTLSGTVVVFDPPGSAEAIVSSENDTDAAVAAVIEKPTFTVNVTSTNGPVNEGEVVTVTSEITNTGDVEGNQTIDLSIPGVGSNSTTVSVSAGASETVSLSIETSVGDGGSYTATVSSLGDSDDAPINIEWITPYFAVNITDTDESFGGQDVDVTAEITNEGASSDSQPIEMNAQPLGGNYTTVSLAPGESTVETFSIGTNIGDAGDYTATVNSENDSDSTTITVAEPPEFPVLQIEVTETSSSIKEGEALSVEAEVTNIGSVGTGTTQVKMDAGPLGTDTKSVNVGGGSSEVRTFSVGTEPGDAGIYSITIQGTEYGGNATTSVPVLAGDSSLMRLESADAPYDIPVDDPLEVEYTVKNIGSGAGTDSVQLSLDKVGLVDSEQVALGPGNSTNGTLVFDDVETAYNTDELIDWTVTASNSGVSKSGVTGLLEVLNVDISTPKDPVAGKQVYFYPQTNVDRSELSEATWEFGNNETTTQVDFLDAVGTTYNQPGQYSVSVAVDAKGQTATDSTTVTVQNDFGVTLNYSPASPTTNENVTFDIGTDLAPDAVESVDITYGDGTGDSFDSVRDGVTQTYNEVGSYEVAVVVTGQEGGTAGDAVSFGVDEVSKIDITTATDSPYLVGESVAFNLNGNTDDITSVAWEFGNGDTGSYVSPETTYEEPGTYQVNATVTVLNSAGFTTYDLATSVEVIERPLIRDISINPDILIAETESANIEVLADRGPSVRSLVVEGPDGAFELERDGAGVVDGNSYGKYTGTIDGGELYQGGDDFGNVELEFVLENSETAPHTQRSSVYLMQVTGALEWAQELSLVPNASTGDTLTVPLIDVDAPLGPVGVNLSANLFSGYEITEAAAAPNISLSAGASADGDVQYSGQAVEFGLDGEFTSNSPEFKIDEFTISGDVQYQPLSIEYESPIPISSDIEVSIGVGVRGSGTYTELPGGTDINDWIPNESDLAVYVSPSANVALLGDIPVGGLDINVSGEVGLNAPLKLSKPYGTAEIGLTAKLGWFERSGSIEWSAGAAGTVQRVTSSDNRWTLQNKYGNSSPADSIENEAIHSLTGDRVQDTNPAIAAQGDSYLVTWSRQNPQKAVTDGRDIYWSILEPGSQNAFTVDGADIETSGTASWTEPAPITNDTNFNAEPDIAVSDDGQRALAVWTRAQGDLETIDSPYDLSDGYDIALATYQNDSWSDPVSVTSNGMYTTSPTVAYRNGEWLVTWQESANITGTEDPRVRFAVYNGTLSSPVTISGAVDPAVGATDDAFTLGYLNVDDGESVNGTVVLQREVPTSGDKLVFETVSTTPATQVTDLSVDNASIGWVDRAGGSSRVRLADADSISVVPTDDEQSWIDQLDLAVGANQTMVTYETDDARLNGTQLSYSAAHDGEWVATRNVTGASNLSFSGAESAVDDGTIRSVFLGTSQADQYPDLFGINHSFLPDLETTATVASPDDPVEPGQDLTIDYTVQNTGEVASDGLQVTVSQGAQQRSSREYAGLAAGETTTGTVTVPVETTEETFTIDATLLNGQQHRTANSVQNLTADIQLPDPELDIASVDESRTGDTYQVQATVDNLGIAPAQNVSTLLVYGDQTVETTDISVLAGETTTVTFTTDVAAVKSSETGTVEIHGTGAPVTEPITGAQPEIQFESVSLADNGSVVTATLGNSGLAGASVPVRVSQSGQTIGTGQVSLPASNGTTTELAQVTVPVALSKNGRTVGVAAQRANSTRAPHDVATISEVPTVFQAQFLDQAVSEQTEATVRNVDTNGTDAVVMVTYQQDGDETVAGVTTGTFGGENVTVTLGTNIGFPDEYTVYVAAADSPAASYEPGDTLPADVTSEIPVSQSARVTTFTNAPDIVVVNAPAKDTTGDGLLNDVRGTGSFNIFDVQTLFSRADSITNQGYAEYFNFQGSNPDEVTIFDVQVLFTQYTN